MTTKLKRKLAQWKQDGGGSAAEIPRDNFTDITDVSTSTTSTTGSASADSSAGAVEQVEQTTQAAAIEVDHYAKRGISMVVSKGKQNRQKIKERQRQPDTQGQPPDTSAPAPGAHGADTPGAPAHPGRMVDASATPQVPTPGDRMRQRAVKQRKEQLTHPRTDTATQGEAPTPALTRADTPARRGQTASTSATPPAPAPGERMRQRAVDQRKEQLNRPRPDTNVGRETPVPTHYGKTSSASGPSTKNLPAGDQSIHPSIKEHPRRSTVLKEKPQAGAIRPKTCQTVEQAARVRAAPTGTPGPTGKKATTKHITDRARKKAQRGMLQKSKQAAQVTADLSKKATQATVKAVKELISALAALVGGGTLAAAMCVIFLVAAVIASPFG